MKYHSMIMKHYSIVAQTAPHTSPRGFHINQLRALNRCAFWQTESLYIEKHLEKTPLPCHEAYSAGARSALMRMRIHVLYSTVLSLARNFCSLIRQQGKLKKKLRTSRDVSIIGALGSPQLRKMSGTSIKSFHEMKGYRDGKSTKRSGTRYCL